MPWYDDLEGPSLEFAASESPRIRALAGPGTGKTFSLTRRVQRLLEEGVHPTNILVVTLTRTAADDLRRGLDSLGVGGSEAVHASTLHSLCFSILSQEEVFQMTGRMTRLLAMFERDILLKDLPDQLGTITQKKSLLVQYEAAWAGLNGSPLGAPPAGLPHEFQNALINYFQWHKCMLVGELVPLAYTYLSQNPYTPILQRFDHILVDEYQDLNRADQAVIELLAASSLSDNRGQLAIIGDDDQSIYVLLRSAHPRGIIEFPADHDVSFVECGRCPRSVVEIAQNLIEHNPERARGPLVPCPGNPEGEIFNVVFETMEDEAEGVARFVDHRIRSGAVDPGEVLIIANWREIAYRIRDRLIELGNDAHSYFSEQALDHRNAQRVLTLLTLLADASDRVALRSWLALSNPTTENRAAYRRIYQYSLQHGLTAAEVILRLAQGNITITHTQSAVDSWNELQEILFQLQRFGNDITALINYLLPEPLEGTTLR
jgi:DNA helicase-2/ATP-dependent DNA helicase PcrA